MADNPVSAGRTTPLSLAASVFGAVGFLVFFVGAFTLDLWPFGALLGLVALVLGWMARRREPIGKRLAVTGLALGAIVVVWFVGFLALVAAGVIPDA